MLNNKNQMSEAARQAQREYNREYYRRNKERNKRQRIEYWERKAKKQKKK